MAIGRIPEPGTGIPESIIAAKGDILTGTANDTPAVLTAGANETRLVTDSAAATGLKYVADTTNYAVAAKGDLLVGTAADTVAPLTVGTNGHTLVADSSEVVGLRWAAPAGGLTYSNWTPSYTNLTIGNGTVVSRYAQSGKFVHWFYYLIFGSTTSLSGAPVLTLPVTAKDATANTTAYFDDSGTAGYTAFALINSTTQIQIYYIGAATAYTQFFAPSSTVPFEWTTGDAISFQISYEAA